MEQSIISILFFVAFFTNLRAAWKLLIDWKGMATTVNFVREAYARVEELPSEDALERRPEAPVFLHLVAAYQEPEIAATLRILLASRYPQERLQVVVITKEEEEENPHPAMECSTGELIRRFHAELPPYEQKRLWHLTMAGEGRKAHQLNRALRQEVLSEILGDHYDPRHVFVGVSDADSFPDENVYRWIAGEELSGRGSLAYQGVTLSLANYERLGIRERISAIQQSSIFIRVSIARLLNEVKRVRIIQAVCRRAPWLRPLLTFCFRRSQICLGHNQFVRLDTLLGIGRFPTDGATEDSTLGYDLGMRGILIRALPMVELNDLPETKEKIIRQNARWYRGVLDDTRHLWRAWHAQPSPFNLAQLFRHVANKVVEWPVAALVYPLMGYLGWHYAYHYRHDHPILFLVAVAAPTASLFLSIWVGGIVTQIMVQALGPFCPKPVELARKTLLEKFLGTFRCQTYWLLATRASWRVLWTVWRTGSYEPAKTDRVMRAEPRNQGWVPLWLAKVLTRRARSGTIRNRGVEQSGSSLGS